MIVFENVAKRYPNGREALAGVSFAIQPGEFVFLTGRSGAGKSSVLKLIALLERPTRGTVTVGGQNTGKLKSGKIPAYRRAIGVVFQDHKLLLDRPIYDNVALPLVVAGTPLKEVDRRVRAALDQVGLLGRERSSPTELSVGEQQRVGIARAVISKPQLLIADEPTGNLDPGAVRRGHAGIQAIPGSGRDRDHRLARPAPGRAIRPARNRARRRPHHRRHAACRAPRRA